MEIRRYTRGAIYILSSIVLITLSRCGSETPPKSTQSTDHHLSTGDESRHVSQDSLTQSNQAFAYEHQGSQRPVGDTADYLITRSVSNLSQYTHIENIYDDFKEQSRLPHRLSNLGPALAVADINNDGLEEVFVGGAKGQKSAYFISQNGKHRSAIPMYHPENEDIAAHFADLNGDGVKDLIVASGSYEYYDGSAYQMLKINYLRDNGTIKRFYSIPLRSNVASIATYDIDQDGNPEIILGGRVIANRYPMAPQSSIYSQVNGDYADLTDRYCPELKRMGMITDIAVGNIDDDPDEEVVIVGEWMPITILNNNGGRLIPEPIANTSGWWNCVTIADLDSDGDSDLICGNYGHTTQQHDLSTQGESLHCYASHSESTGTLDLTISDKIDPTIDAGLHLEVNELSHLQMINDGTGNFERVPLPTETQLSPIRSIVICDVDSDGYQDLICAGSRYDGQRETDQSERSTGYVLLGGKSGLSQVLQPQISGFLSKSEVRNLSLLSNRTLVSANNNSQLEVFQIIK